MYMHACTYVCIYVSIFGLYTYMHINMSSSFNCSMPYDFVAFFLHINYWHYLKANPQIAGRNTNVQIHI